MEVGGIGIDVFVSRIALEQCREGDVGYLLTRLIVREDSLTLYGFANQPERELFDALLKVSGVGPRLAMTILSSLSIDNLRQAIMNDRVEMITRVPGIGKKTAQKIMLELKDKLPMGLDAIPVSGFDDLNSDVMDALITLGYSVVEAQTAIQSLPNDAPENTEARIVLALQYLGK
jgi:Holliday junction DNA helicase RuvA